MMVKEISLEEEGIPSVWPVSGGVETVALGTGFRLVWVERGEALAAKLEPDISMNAVKRVVRARTLLFFF